MRITNLEILNFRGIQKASIAFPLDTRIICIIGAGDTTKSTLLKAIEWAFWPSWNLTAFDTDFLIAILQPQLSLGRLSQMCRRGLFLKTNMGFICEDRGLITLKVLMMNQKMINRSA